MSPLARLYKRWPPRDDLSAAELDDGLAWLVRNGVGGQMMETLSVGAFMTAYALELGATNLAIGLLAAIPHITQLLQLAGVPLADRLRNRRLLSIVAAGLSRPMFLVIAAAAFVVCVPVFLVLTNVRIAATEERVFDYGFSAYNVPAVTGLERAQLDAAAHEIVRYFTSGDSNSLLDIRVQTPTGSAQPLYSDREVIHMRDVKQLFQFFFRVHEVAFAYIVVYVAGVYLWAREQSLRIFA